jgi:hypothetical protein
MGLFYARVNVKALVTGSLTASATTPLQESPPQAQYVPPAQIGTGFFLGQWPAKTREPGSLSQPARVADRSSGVGRHSCHSPC